MMNVPGCVLCLHVDPGCGSKPKLLFQTQDRIARGQGFDGVLVFFCLQRNVPVLDFLRLAKSADSRLVENPICLDPFSLQSKTSAAPIEPSPHVGESPTDRSKIGARRHTYAGPFTFDGALKCPQNGNSLPAVDATIFALARRSFL
jgi:hypothetical protein